MHRKTLSGLTVAVAAAALLGVGLPASEAGVPAPSPLEGSIVVEASGMTTFGLGAVQLTDPGSVDPVAQRSCPSSHGYLRFGLRPKQAILKDYWAAQTGDGTMLARVEKCSGKIGPLVEVDLVTGQATPLPTFPGIVGYGPDSGTLLAVSPKGSGVSVLDRDSGAVLWSMGIGPDVWVSADRTRYAVSRGTGNGWEWASYGDVTSTISVNPPTNGSERLSPDVSQVARIGAGRLAVTDFDTAVTTDVAATTGVPFWSPDGGRILVRETTGAGMSLWLYDVVGDSVVPVDSGVAATYLSSLWSPDGTRVLVLGSGADQKVSDAWVVDATTGTATTVDAGFLAQEDVFSLTPRWAPTSDAIAFVTGRHALTVLSAAGAVLTQQPLSHYVLSVGPWLACAGSCPAVGAAATPCTITGTSGPDVLVGTPQHDVICGGAGNDVLKPGSGLDTVIGGTGLDTVDESDSPRWVDANLEDWQVTRNGRDRLSSVENVVGSRLGDYLRGDYLNNRLISRGGADIIFGNDGADRLDGGAGQDILRGNRGSDRLSGGPGVDSLAGGGGLDLCYQDGWAGASYAC